jgi:hypothetical protein
MTYFGVFELVMRFLVIGFFFVTTVPPVVLGVVIDLVIPEPAEDVVVLAVIVANASRTVIIPDIVIAEKVAVALLEVMATGTLVVIVDGVTVVLGIAEVPAEVVVVLAVFVADVARPVILSDIVIAEKVAAASFWAMAAGTLVVIIDGATVVIGIVITEEPRGCGVSGNCSRTVILPGTALGVDVFPDGTAQGIGIVVAEVGMVAEIIPDGTSIVAGADVMELAEVIFVGPAGIVKAEVAVVSEVTEVSPDGKSMVTSVPVLAPVSAITLETKFVANEVDLPVLASTAVSEFLIYM